MSFFVHILSAMAAETVFSFGHENKPESAMGIKPCGSGS